MTDQPLFPVFCEWLLDNGYEDVYRKYIELVQARKDDSKPLYDAIDAGNVHLAHKLMRKFADKWGEDDMETIAIQTWIDVL